MRREDVDLPAVHRIKEARVSPDGGGVRRYRVDVVADRIVVIERAANIRRRAVRVEVVGGAEDRVVRMVDVAAEPYAARVEGRNCIGP